MEAEGTATVEHQYMCSECGQLYNTLEEVLLHQQSHVWLHVYVCPELGEPEAKEAGPCEEESRFQCLECGQLLNTPEELLQHQGTHAKEGEACGKLEQASDGGLADVVHHYQCSECMQIGAPGASNANSHLNLGPRPSELLTPRPPTDWKSRRLQRRRYVPQSRPPPW